MSDLIDIFKEAIIYPLSNIIILLILGVLLLISNLPTVLLDYGFEPNISFVFIFGIISLIISIFVYGYGLSVIKDAINMDVTVPELDIAKNFIDGIKAVVLSIVYFIIPTIIAVIVFFISGGFAAISDIFAFINENYVVLNQTVQSTNGLVNADFINLIPQEYLSSLLISSSITILVAVILYIIFSLLYEIAMCRLAKYDSLSEGLRFGEVINDIRAIGIGKYIGWYILFIIITFILSIIVGIITAIPYIGIILSYLICTPFVILFGYRALGLLYLRAEHSE